MDGQVRGDPHWRNIRLGLLVLLVRVLRVLVETNGSRGKRNTELVGRPSACVRTYFALHHSFTFFWEIVLLDRVQVN